jgi:ring-1,2-phenylacetyl-CoA epoxidase subunit PaaE
VLEVMPPVGKFILLSIRSKKRTTWPLPPAVAITPVISIIKTTLRTEPKSQFTLVYGNRNKNSIIFKEELEGLKDKFIDRFGSFIF